MDSDTPAAARHDAVERFNAPDAPAGFLFLCATRCCGLGTNLPTVAAVVLFDSDWDARSDIQVRTDAAWPNGFAACCVLGRTLVLVLR